MPPQTPNIAPNPVNPDYNFIMTPQQPQKRSPFSPLLGGNSFIKRLVIIIGGAVVLVIIIVVLASIFLRSSVDTKDLTSLAQQQTELVRVATEANSEAIDQTTKNLAANIQLTITTDQLETTSFLSKHHAKLSTKTLDLDHSATTDQQLSQAQSASNFDQVYVQITENALKTYQQSLEQSLKATTNQTVRQFLNQDLSNTQLLLVQATSAAQALQQS